MALLAFVDIVHRKARFVKGFCNIAPIIRGSLARKQRTAWKYRDR